LVSFVLIRCFRTSPKRSSFFTPAADECGGENAAAKMDNIHFVA
jgi:hypothetical protein